MNLKNKTLTSLIILLIGVLAPYKTNGAEDQIKIPFEYLNDALTTPDAVISTQHVEKLSWELLISARAYRVKGKLGTALDLLTPRVPQTYESNTSPLALFAEMEIAWNLTEAGYAKEAQVITNRYSDAIRISNDSTLLSFHFFLRGFIAEYENPPLASELFNKALLTSPLINTAFKSIIQSHLAKLYLDGGMINEAEKVIKPIAVPELASSNTFLYREAIIANFNFLLKKNSEIEAMAFLKTAITTATLISDTATLLQLYYYQFRQKQKSPHLFLENDQGAYILLTKKIGWGTVRQTFTNDTSLINNLERFFPGSTNKLPSLLSSIYQENHKLASTISHLVLFPKDIEDASKDKYFFRDYLVIALIILVLLMTYILIRAKKRLKEINIKYKEKADKIKATGLNKGSFSSPIGKQSLYYFNIAAWTIKTSGDQVYSLIEKYNLESIPIKSFTHYFEVDPPQLIELFSEKSKEVFKSLVHSAKTVPWIWHKEEVALNNPDQSQKSYELFAFGNESEEISFLLRPLPVGEPLMSNTLPFPAKELFNSIPIPVFIKDKNFKLVYVNQAFTEVIQKKTDQLIGKTDFDLFPQSQAEIFRQSDEKVLKGITHSFEEESQQRTGKTHFYITKKLITNPNDSEPFIIGVMQDISYRVSADQELIRMRDEAVQLTRNKSEFLANMSHEIRTPMNAILGMAELLGESALDAEQRELTEIVFKAANNLLQLINDILDLSKIEARQVKIRQEPYFLVTLIHEVVSMLNYSRQDKAVDIITDIDPNIPEQLIGDEFRLRQIITNLANNALKFTKKGNVTIKCRFIQHPSPFLRFEIIDTGTGVPEEHIPFLFNPFYQVEIKSKLPRGTGLGLAISKQLALAMGGQIGVESVPGKGSNFWFTIPVKQQIVQESPSLSQESTKSKGLEILIVEDNATNQQLLVANLRKYHVNTTLADNGKEAVEFYKTGHFDLVLMDIQMPIMDGFEAAKLIREFEEASSNKRTPLVAVTAYTIENELNPDFDGILRKPYHSDELRSLLLKFFPNIELKK